MSNDLRSIGRRSESSLRCRLDDGLHDPTILGYRNVNWFRHGLKRQRLEMLEMLRLSM
jgi:hypothetical protein